MKKSKIRILYLYVFALVGLVLVVIGAVRIVDIGLKVYIFKQADQPMMYDDMPPYPPISVELQTTSPESQEKKDAKYSEKVTAEQKEMLDKWILDYKNWEERQKN